MATVSFHQDYIRKANAINWLILKAIVIEWEYMNYAFVFFWDICHISTLCFINFDHILKSKNPNMRTLPFLSFPFPFVCHELVCLLMLQSLNGTRTFTWDALFLRVCQQEKEELLIDLGCHCRGALARAHRSCIDTWFRTRGSNKCEICQ